MINLSKMRIILVPSVAILSTSLVFLVTATQESSANPAAAVVSAAITVLRPFIDSYLGDLRAKREAEKIETRVWMHTGDPKMNGCGFYFEVTGHSGNSVHDWFPPTYFHKCGSEMYDMRMTSQSAMYSEKLQLGNDQTKKIQVHADGWRDTFVKMLCFGLSERTIAGGPRAFCIDNDLLKSCKALTNKWNDVILDSDNVIKFTRTIRGIHKIIFTDVENLISGFEALAENPGNEDAVQKICDRIDLVRGDNADWFQDCQAGRFATIPFLKNPIITFLTTRYIREDKNPDGCERNEDNHLTPDPMAIIKALPLPG